ncbi:MAG: enoyl-CoA hydratase [Myxococcales bacterium]|nr:enoyl-CoA hydratase [Myxococcales bacterium]
MSLARDYLIVDEALPKATITLNRPKQLNALSTGMMRELTATLRELGARQDVRVVVLRGAGRAFCAGHDLEEMNERSLDEERAIFADCTEMMQTIQTIPQPVIAGVHGVATAAGCQLVATCDLALCSDDARFATSGIRYGLFCSTPGVAVARNIGRKNALYMLLTGRFIDAATAVRWGLVNRAVPAGELDGAVDELVAELAALSREALAVGKRGFYQQVEMPQADAYARMSDAIAANACHPDGQEGIRAFLDKRSPAWPAQRKP